METAVKLENVTKRFLSTTGSKYSEALTDISFEIAKGSLTILAGANGSGKSVLMNLISGLMKVSEGKIEVSSKPGLVFQEASTQILGDTPREELSKMYASSKKLTFRQNFFRAEKNAVLQWHQFLR